MKLTSRQIEQLVRQGEVVHTECKDACGGMPDALWSKNGFPIPIITEELNPDRVRLTVCTTANQKNGSTRLDNNQTIRKVRIDNKPKIMSNIDNNKTLKDCSSLNSSTRRVYMAIAEDPFMTRQGLSSRLDLSRATIAAATATLIKLNFIRREGSKKTGHWEVIEEE